MFHRVVIKVLAAAVLVAWATPAIAQTGLVKGKVQGPDGKPVADAVVTIETTDGVNRKLTTKSDRRGEFVQLGLQSGGYRVTATADKLGTGAGEVRVRIGQTTELTITLSATPPGTDPKVAELRKAFEDGVTASRASDFDGAIAKFQAALGLQPTCHECYYNIGYAYLQKKDEKQAEDQWKKALEQKADHAETLTALATLYNGQKRFDEAAAVSAKAAAASPGGNADAIYNQGIILWNAGKIAEAKLKFEETVAADPNHADSRFQLGMALLNEGKIPEAVGNFEKYLQMAPSGQFAAQAKAMLAQLKPPGGVSSVLADTIAARLAQVRDRIDRAAARAGRDPSAIRLVAVSKTYPVEHVRAAVDAGQRDFGENKVQEGLQKIADAADTTIRWHVIGHLQSNKARRAAEAFDWIHAIDSVGLLRKVDEGAAAAGRRPKALVQVDLAGEATKFGASPEEVPAIFAAAAELNAVELVGLMLLPPAVEDPNDARSWFRRLVAVRGALAASGVPAARLTELSMGMSHDFEVAIEEGATIVRIGSAIFGERR